MAYRARRWTPSIRLPYPLLVLSLEARQESTSLDPCRAARSVDWTIPLGLASSYGSGDAAPAVVSRRLEGRGEPARTGSSDRECNPARFGGTNRSTASCCSRPCLTGPGARPPAGWRCTSSRTPAVSAEEVLLALWRPPTSSGCRARPVPTDLTDSQGVRRQPRYHTQPVREIEGPPIGSLYGKEKFVNDSSAAWAKVVNLDRFDL